MKKLDVVGVIIGLAIFLLAIGELNNLVAHYIFSDLHDIEVFSLPILGKLIYNNGAWYNLIMWLIGLGTVTFAFSLAGWMTKAKEKLQEKI